MPYRNVYMIKWTIIAYFLACLVAALVSIWFIIEILLPKSYGLSTEQTRLLDAVFTGSVKNA